MQINTLSLATSSWKFIVTNLFITLFSIMPTQAQNLTPRIKNMDSTVNGLFTPTAADLFFQEGRENFEEEIKLNRQNNFDIDLLKIDEELLKEQEENRPFQDIRLEVYPTP